MSARRIEFEGALGHKLAARLEEPAGTPAAYALFAHCFTCSKDSLAATRIARALCGHGIAVLRFDFTGLGGSEGDFANTDFSSNVEDLVRAAGYLREHHRAPRILIGHSLGGSAVLAAAGAIPETAAVATIGAPSDPAHVALHFAEALPELEARDEISVEIGGRRFRIRRRFLEDISDQNLQAAVRGLRAALLVMHSPRDGVVAVDHARHLYEAARHPKSFVSLDDADHLLSRRRDAEYVAAVLAAWSHRYLPQAEETEEAEEAEPALERGVVEVAETGEGRYTQRVHLGRHRLVADEPEDAGGDDAGPSPYDLLLAALGSCTTMTLRMYAEHKGIALERAAVSLRHRKIHAEDCRDCESKAGRIDEIEREIRLEGELTAAQRERFLQIADKCPVHRTLRSETRIRSRLAEDGD